MAPGIPKRRVVALATGVLLLVGCPGAPGTPDPTDPPADITPWLVEIGADAGLDFVHFAGAAGGLYLPEITGGGVALADLDGDGDLDAYLTNQNRTFAPGDGEPPRNRLYLQGDDGRFVDATDASGLGDPGFGQGVAVCDVDNDGDLDVYVANLGDDALYVGRGDGTFADASAGLDADTSGWSVSVACFDYDVDGLLDLYVTQYVVHDEEKRCFDHTGEQQYCGPSSYAPAPDLLLHNEGGGRFRDVSVASGIAGAAAAGLGVISEDFDDDGLPDLYVANDGYANFLWLNNGDGTFRDDALVLGAAYNMHGRPEAGMGVLAGDFDGDGHRDLFVTHLRQESNTLYRGGAGAAFRDATGQADLAGSSMAFTGFGTAAFDLELDGDLDLFVVNGRVLADTPHPGARMGPPWSEYAEPNLVYRNRGTSFELLGDEVAAFTGTVENSRGLAVGDVDDDGDVDLLVGNIDGPARLYRNDAPRAGHWLSVRAVDPRLRRDAIGAVVTVLAGDRAIRRTVTGAYSYASANDLRAHFGLGAAETFDAVEVVWPDGLRERFAGGASDRAVVLRRGEGETR